MAQSMSFDFCAATTGLGFTCTFTSSVVSYWQTFSFMYTENSVVVFGEATGLGDDALFTKPAGVHEYVSPPLAFSVTACPSQMVFEGETVNAGFWRMLTLTGFVFTQVLASVTVTV